MTRWGRRFFVVVLVGLDMFFLVWSVVGRWALALAGRLCLWWHFWRRLSDELAEPAQSASADDSVCWVFVAWFYEGIWYVCGDQNSTHNQPNLLVQGTQPERIALTLARQIAATRGE